MSKREIKLLYDRNSLSEEHEESMWSEKISLNEDNEEELLVDEGDYAVISKNFAPINDKNLLTSDVISEKVCVNRENRKKLKFIVTRDGTPPSLSFLNTNTNKNLNPTQVSHFPKNDLRIKQRFYFHNKMKNSNKIGNHPLKIRRNSKI